MMIRAVTLKRLVAVFIGMALLTAVLWRVEIRGAVVTAAIALAAVVIIVCALSADQLDAWTEKKERRRIARRIGGVAADR